MARGQQEGFGKHHVWKTPSVLPQCRITWQRGKLLDPPSETRTPSFSNLRLEGGYENKHLHK